MYRSITDDAALKSTFCALSSGRELSELLGIQYSNLVYYTYKIPTSKRYTPFLIPKKSGGQRTIYAPAPGLRFIQRHLNIILQRICVFKTCVTGFVCKRSIIDNARIHRKKRFVLNIDIHDFFPSINFGRVYGIFQTYPLQLNQQLAAIIAQLCCHNGSLPQGAPTSPILSNLICMKMDNKLLGLSKRAICNYSRYADDMSFSTSLTSFPDNVASYDSEGTVSLGAEVQDIIQSNGFQINTSKVRLRSCRRRLEVTGLIVNKKLNVRRRYYNQLRAIAHACKKFGTPSAAHEFFSRYDKKGRTPKDSTAHFQKIVRGKLAFMRSVLSKDDSRFLKLCKTIRIAAPEIIGPYLSIKFGGKVTVQTEGKTDPIHMQAALSHFHSCGEYNLLDIKFLPGKGSDKTYKKLHEFGGETPPSVPFFFVFDRDEPKILNRIREPGNDYKSYNEHCYALAIPLPHFRNQHQDICIEHLYQDGDIVLVDRHGRRLYFAEEFDSTSGQLLADSSIRCSDGKRMRRNKTIIDDNVVNASGNNVALPKIEFATNISKKIPPFDGVNFDGFRPLFDVLMRALQE